MDWINRGLVCSLVQMFCFLTKKTIPVIIINNEYYYYTAHMSLTRTSFFGLTFVIIRDLPLT